MGPTGVNFCLKEDFTGHYQVKVAGKVCLGVNTSVRKDPRRIVGKYNHLYCTIMELSLIMGQDSLSVEFFRRFQQEFWWEKIAPSLIKSWRPNLSGPTFLHKATIREVQPQRPACAQRYFSVIHCRSQPTVCRWNGSFSLESNLLDIHLFDGCFFGYQYE